MYTLLTVVWCYVRVVPDSSGQIDHSATILAEVLGYELWFYATIAGLVAIYLTMLCYLKFMVGDQQQDTVYKE